MREYLIKRSIYTLVLVFFAITVNFFIFIALPSDPVSLIAAPTLKPEQIKAIIDRYGLTPGTPIWVKYEKYIVNMLTGQFGFSFRSQAPVITELWSRIPYTIELLGISTLVAIVIGTMLGVFAARWRGQAVDSFSVTSSLVTYSLPTFWMGLISILIFFTFLHWFPAGGAFPLDWSIPGHQPANFIAAIPGLLSHLFLPAAVLVLFQYGGFLLLTRATMLEVLSEDYIVTARAKGLTERAVLFNHALKNASLPLITNAALNLGFVISGAVLTETVFNWPGLGRWTFESIQLADFPALQAIFFITAVSVILANFASDVLLGVVDPRIKYG